MNRAVEQYSDMIQRLCMIHLKNYADTEDIFQTVFLKYVLSSVSFESEEHEKSWFIRVTLNACRDLLKSFFHRRTTSLEEILEQPAQVPEDYRDVLKAVLTLPPKYREVVYLHYYEGYTAPEISRILRKNVNTIYTLLTRSLDIRFMDYSEAVSQIMENEEIAALLSRNEIMTIAVTGADSAQSEEILAGLQSCTAGRNNTHCYYAHPDEIHAAHEAGLPYGKYRAYLELLALDPTVTPEEIQDMTMREIRERINALSNGGDASWAPHGKGHGPHH